MRAALSWAMERGEAELGLRLAGALWRFWQLHGDAREGRKWLEEALAKDDRASVAGRVRALEAVGWLNHDQRDLDRADEAAQEGIELCTEVEIGSSFAASFRTMLGTTAKIIRGDYERAKELLEESLTLSRKADDKIRIAEPLLELGATSLGLGNRERAKEFYEDGLVLCREVGYMYRLPDFLNTLGYISILEGDFMSEERR
jgi:tetratricopeptide (TPR) repeat protein